jgi:hypothetical protein
MNKSELQSLLDGLRSEMRSTPFRDEQARERLSATIAEIEQQLLNAEAGAVPSAEGVVNGLKTAVEQFELEHPQVAALLNRLVLALSAMGI